MSDNNSNREFTSEFSSSGELIDIAVHPSSASGTHASPTTPTASAPAYQLPFTSPIMSMPPLMVPLASTTAPPPTEVLLNGVKIKVHPKPSTSAAFVVCILHAEQDCYLLMAEKCEEIMSKACSSVDIKYQELKPELLTESSGKDSREEPGGANTETSHPISSGRQGGWCRRRPYRREAPWPLPCIGCGR